MITVNDFDIPALREDAENSEEKKSESPAQNQDEQVFTETVPETSHPAPLSATAKYSRSPCSVSPLRSQMKRRSAIATPTSWPAKASSIAIFATNDKTRRRKRRSPPAPSSADAGGKVSIVRHRRNKKDWILRMKSEDAPRLTRPISNLMNRKATGDEN